MATDATGEEPKKLIDIISIDDLPSDIKLIAELCGFDTAKILLERCAGIQIYIPKLERLPEIVKKYVVHRYGDRELTSAEIKALSLDIGLSSSYLRREFGMLE